VPFGVSLPRGEAERIRGEDGEDGVSELRARGETGDTGDIDDICTRGELVRSPAGGRFDGGRGVGWLRVDSDRRDVDDRDDWVLVSVVSPCWLAIFLTADCFGGGLIGGKLGECDGEEAALASGDARVEGIRARAVVGLSFGAVECSFGADAPVEGRALFGCAFMLANRVALAWRSAVAYRSAFSLASASSLSFFFRW